MARVLPKHAERIFSRAPHVDMTQCTRCMRCVNVCPSGAIDPGNLKIDRTKCLHCFACVRVCAPEARKIVLKLKLLSKNALKLQAKKRKEPEIFI
jgi:ferredoxin